MSKREIEKKFDEIVAFAEVEKFIDTPVKHYSSGMYVRLAFAVAAHLEPEILVVDEVLAVGDAQFQKKCLGKMGDVAKEGRTVLFVSHNMAAVKSLCGRSVLLDLGQVVQTGETTDVIQSYLEGGIETPSAFVWSQIETAPGNEKARLLGVRITDICAQPISQIDIESPFAVEVEYHVLCPDTVLNLSLSIFNFEDVYVLSSPSITDKQWFQHSHPTGIYRSRCIVPGGLLNQGRYNVTILLVENGRHIITQQDRIVSIDMVDLGVNRGGYFGYWGGVVRPMLQWNTDRLERDGIMN
jgi:lipopolysaccharide transport system ATP-binding protein